MKKFFVFLFFLILITSLFAEDIGDGRWQGYEYPLYKGKEKVKTNYLILDTGGSGGGFGQGDVHSHLNDIYFWDENTGVSCGYGGVFRTDDGGFTWKRLREKGSWYYIGMTGKDEIWLLEGFHGQPRANLYLSKDGGKTWEKILSEEKLHGWADLFCSGDIIWVIGGDFSSFYSNDRGKTWKEIGFWGSHKISIPGDYMSSNDGGYTVYILCDHRSKETQKPYLKKSKDGGNTWENIELPEEFNNMKSAHRWSLFFVDSMKGWIGLSEGNIAYTEDGGKTWELRKIEGCNQDVVALWFDKIGRGFAAVGNWDINHLKDALYMTDDGGKTWRSVLSGQKQINSIFGFGPDKIWACGTQPSLIPNDLIVILKIVNEK